MKRCLECGREYDNTMAFCLDDGAELKAIEHLDRGIDEHESEVVYIRNFHYYDFMRDDRRFKELMKKVGFRE